MGSCTSSSLTTRSQAAQPAAFSAGDAASTGSKASLYSDKYLGPVDGSRPINSSEQTPQERTYFTYGRGSADFSERIPNTDSEKRMSTNDPMALSHFEQWHGNICESVVISPESDFVVEVEDYSRDRDDEVVTVVSNAGSKSLVSVSKVSFDVFDAPSTKTIHEKDPDEDHSHPISNISSLTSASPIPSPMNSLSFTECDPEECIVVPRLEKSYDLRKSRSLFGNSFGSLATQLSPNHKILPVDMDVYEDNEMEDCINW